MPFIYAVSGFKNSGKTTLIESLVSVLSNKGYKVCVIKHDGHDFEGDVPGTDSYRAFKSGAYGTCVFSGGHYLLHKRTDCVSEMQLVQMFPEADIVLLEGFKDSAYPKYVCDWPNKIPDVEKIANNIEMLMKAYETDKN